MKEITLESSYDSFKLNLNIYEIDNPIGVVQVIHGMSEHQQRYKDLAIFLNNCGYIVCTSDTRGHGKSVNENFPLGYFGKKGHEILVQDQLSIANFLSNNYSLPLVLFAHSMGTITSRVILQNNSSFYSKVILSGMPNYQSLSKFGILLINTIRLFKGKKGHSKLLKNMITGPFNKVVKNPRSDNEWISYNYDNIIKYDNDKLCGFPFTIYGYKALLKLLIQSHKRNAYKKDNPNLPILLLVGKDDPCTGGDKGINTTINTLSNSFNNLELAVFENMRHEVLNENNNEAVYNKIKSYL